MSAESMQGMDGVFITMDSANAPLHVGIVLELEPDETTTKDPARRFEEIQATIERRLGQIEVLRKRVVRVPFDLGPPILVDDPEFDISFHLVRRAIAAPGGAKELEALVARVMARPLAPDRPLWEISVIEGLENDRRAILAKIHHGLTDGVSGVTVFAGLFDIEQNQTQEVVGIESDLPAPIPTPLEMLARSSSEMLRRPAAVLEAIGTSLEHMADRVDGRLSDLSSSASTLFSAPRTSLSGTVSHGRNFERMCLSLPVVKEITHDHGGTVTDFALAIVGGAMRRLLELRGEAPEAELVAFMPVNIRTPGTEGELGNRISARLVPMASGIVDPSERLAVLAERGRTIRESGSQEGDILTEVANALGPAMMSMTGKIIEAFELFDHLPHVANVVISSVPGPPIPLWCSGERIIRASPMGPLMFNQALNITLIGYCDSLEFGVLACSRKVPDATRLRELMEDEAVCLLGEEGAYFHASSA